MYIQERKAQVDRAVLGLWGGGTGSRSPELPIKNAFLCPGAPEQPGEGKVHLAAAIVGGICQKVQTRGLSESEAEQRHTFRPQGPETHGPGPRCLTALASLPGPSQHSVGPLLSQEPHSQRTYIFPSLSRSSPLCGDSSGYTPIPEDLSFPGVK